jgi:acyl dehydratase
MVEMAQTDLAAVTVGYRLPSHLQPPISRATLALFAGASNDHVPLHIDSDFAKAVGMDDVFGHGMLSMAYLAQLLTHWVPEQRLVSWQVRFTAITPLYASVECEGEVIAIVEQAGRSLARVAVSAATTDGVRTIEGEALVRLD